MEQRVRQQCGNRTSLSVKRQKSSDSAEAEQIMAAIRSITDRGHNAEVKRRSDGSLAVYEVEKRISIG